MDEVEIISEEVVFKVEIVVILEEIIVGIEIEKAQDLDTIRIKRKRNEN